MRWRWVRELQTLGVEIIPYARLFGARGDAVYSMHTLWGAALAISATDTLVLAQGDQPAVSPEKLLTESGAAVRPAGACLSRRSAEDAVYEGMVAGRDV